MKTDDDHDHDHDAGHTDAEGFVLETAEGTELYKELEGTVVTNNLSVAVGQELELAVHFLTMMVKKLSTMIMMMNTQPKKVL